MSADTLALIDADIATLTTLVDAPDPATLGYGTDLDCIADVTADFAEVDSNSALGVAQACIRRLTCQRGANPDDANYGLWLPGYCNHGVTTSDLTALNGQIALELKKDDRVESLTVTCSTNTLRSSALSVSIQLTPAVPGLDPFSFTLSVTDASVLLETLS